MQKDYERAIQPKLCDAASYTKISGRYFISNVANIRNTDFKANVLLTLSDATGDYSVYVNYCPNTKHDYIRGELVFLRASLRRFGGTEYHLVDSMVRQERIERIGSDLSILPRALCPTSDAFDCFMELVKRIEFGFLRDFIEDTLLQPNIAIPFITWPATQEGHHSYAGGLIKHAVEVAWNVYGVQELSELERDFAVTAAVLHGIGRLKPFTSVHCDQLKLAQELNDNIEIICDGALKNLKEKLPPAANEMRHLMTFLNRGANDRLFGFPTRLETLLKKAKKISEENDSPEYCFPCFGESNHTVAHAES